MYLEKQILGCFLKDNSLLKDTAITKHFFSDDINKSIYESMQKLSREDTAIDKVTLLSENFEILDKLGGATFIDQIEHHGDVENFDSYEKKLTQEFKARASEKIVKTWLSKEEKDIDQLLDRLQKMDDFAVEDDPDKNAMLTKLHDEAFTDNKDKQVIATGLKDLDNYMKGFRNQSSYIMAARPSMGKTATMLKFVLEAIEQDAVPLVFSLEMSGEELTRRLVSTIGEINLFIATNPYELSDRKKDDWKYATNELFKKDYEIYDKPMQTIPYIRSKVRKAKKKYEGRQIIVFIDYMTLIHHEGKFNSDHAKVTDISRNLKMIAKEYDCPVVTLAQLSRAVEARQDKRPLLSDIRESGSIEQDADMVMFLYRENYYNQDIGENELEIIIAKQRNGPTGKAKVYYNKATGKMGDLSEN
ncbi:replicative DNA helicase [Gracilibacillus thailandensis]|uniref:DNA 5'-3' helicase n=1 Tax=Gracilibacillus thailandensis TaxID=563735 RepID=A0A6N7QVZ2_9BACI|nr:DnaB-like helicase C-terminal domain-containing protein [Gracilibacillus thailandensis]MRI65131.1 hypothetical protein [Gracilibacillus thailandensis]